MWSSIVAHTLGKGRVGARAPCAFAVMLCLALAARASFAQLYDTPETRQSQTGEQERARQRGQISDAEAKQAEKANSAARKKAEADSYVGKTFWYLPNPAARARLRFYERVPPSSHSQDPNLLFTPLTITSFTVARALVPPPVVYAPGEDEYLLEIQFPDGKIGYVNVVGRFGLKENMYAGEREESREYVSASSAQEVLANEQAAREKRALEERLAKEAAALKEAQERALEQKERARAEASERAARAAAEKERAIREAKERTARDAIEKERQRRAALPAPQIGMTQRQVVDGTSWGAPSGRSRTTTANGVSEQWVYGLGRYLYFTNGRLTAIQD